MAVTGRFAAAADQFARGVPRALVLEILPQFLRIHVVGVFVDVDELRQRARLRNRFGGRDEGVRHGDDHVAWLHACRHQGEAQSIGAAADGDGMFGVAELWRNAFSKFFDHGAADEAGGAERLLKHLRSVPVRVRRAE